MIYAKIAWAYIKDKHYWPLVVAIVLVAWGVMSLQAPDPKIEVSTDCSGVIQENAKLKADLTAKAKAYAKLVVKATDPVPSGVEGCPPCPGCPEVVVDCGGSGGTVGSGDASANVAIGMTAGAKVELDQSALRLGVTGGVYSHVNRWDDFGAHISLNVNDLSVFYQPGLDGSQRVGGAYTLWFR